MKSPSILLGSLALAFLACVVVPPPENSTRQSRRSPAPPPVAGNGAMYGGQTYGLNTCSNSYGGATYGGATCGSWITDAVIPAAFTRLGPGVIGVAVMQQSGSAPCRTPTFRDCAPAIGADVTLVDVSTGAPISAKTDQQGFLYARANPGTYKVRVEYLGTAVEGTVTFDAAALTNGSATIGASLALSDRR